MPHSDIHGSKLIRSSPRLFAAYHVLHRLCMPRHPPNALKTLNRSHCQCSSLSGFGIPILLACARSGSKPGHRASVNKAQAKKSASPKRKQTNQTSGYLLQPDSQMPLTRSIDLLYRSHAERLTCSLSLKTSFSRLNPGSRGQATIISDPSEAAKATNNERPE